MKRSLIAILMGLFLCMNMNAQELRTATKKLRPTSRFVGVKLGVNFVID